MAGQFVRVPMTVYEADINSAAKIVYMRLLAHLNQKTGQCNPRIATLARQLDISYSTVRRAIKVLRKNGFLRTKKGRTGFSFELLIVAPPPPSRSRTTEQEATKQTLDRLRECFSSEESMLQLVGNYCEKLKTGDPEPDSFVDFLSLNARSNTQVIFELCESPIELYFWNSFQIHFLDARKLLVIDSRANSFTLEERRSTYIRFASAHCFHLDLQSTIQGPDDCNIRPDGVLWIPSQEDLKVVVECDGFDYHSDHEAFTRDRQRDRWFSQNGFTVRRYSGSEIFRDPAKCTSDLADFLFSKAGRAEPA